MPATEDPRDVDQLLALAREAVAAVLDDLHRTSALRPHVVVDIWMENSVRVVIDDGFTAPSMFESAAPEAVAEIANYFQEPIHGDVGVWPLCAQHHAGLHAEVRKERAVWCCRPGGHDVAAIGRLGTP